MSEVLIGNILGKNIFLLKDNNISFYISVPVSGVATICLNLVSDSSKIASNIGVEELYGDFNVAEDAVVTPVIDNNILEQVKLNNNPKVFSYLNQVMAYLINAGYNFLVGKGVNVNKSVKLNNNTDYNAFNSWFVNKYNGRVVLTSYEKQVVQPVNKLEQFTGNVNQGDVVANTVLDDTIKMDAITNDSVPISRTELKEPGFVSYVLLGVVVAVVSLVILYMLL